MRKEHKTESYLLRLTPTEKKNLETKAEQSKMTISQYLIQLSESKKIIVAENVPDLFLEITRIGVNINQIAHVANSQKYVNTQQIYEVKKLLREVQVNMEKIIKALEDEEEVTYQTLEKRFENLELRFGNIEELIKLLTERIDSNGNR